MKQPVNALLKSERSLTSLFLGPRRVERGKAASSNSCSRDLTLSSAQAEEISPLFRIADAATADLLSTC